MRFPIVIGTLMFCSVLPAQIAVVNNASFRAGYPVAPGSWVSGFAIPGTTFPGVSTTTAPGYPLPKTLGGVTLSVNSVDAPLYYVSSSQIVFLIPYATTPGVQAVQVKTSTATVTGSVRVISAAPGIFMQDTAVPPRGAIRNADGIENTSSAPTQRGRTISIFGTGPGALDFPPKDGDPAARDPLAKTKSTPQVFIGGVEARVDFSGLSPDFAGLWQTNAVVPDKPFITGRVPVQVFVDGVDSNEVTVFVAP